MKKSLIFCLLTTINLISASRVCAAQDYPVHRFDENTHEELYSLAHQRLKNNDQPLTLDNTAQAMKSILKEQGYFLADVHYRAGESSEDIFLLIHEGEINSLEVHNAPACVEEKIRAQLKPFINTGPVHYDDFTRAILNINDMPGVDIIAHFEPDEHGLEVHLIIDAQFSKQNGYIALEGYSDHVETGVHLTGQQQIHSLFLVGDNLAITLNGHYLNADAHAIYGDGLYTMPGLRFGDYIDIFAGNSQFINTEIESQRAEFRATSYRAAYAFLLTRRIDHFSYFVPEFDHIASKQELGDQSFKKHSNQFRLSYYGTSYLDNTGTVEYSLTFTQGRNGDPSPIENKHFNHFRGGVFYTFPFQTHCHNFSFSAELMGQISLSNLAIEEKMVLGHKPMLRGYAEGETFGDHGAAATLDLNYHAHSTGLIGSNTYYVFVDIGRTWDENYQSLNPDKILASLGVGFDMQIAQTYSLGAWLATPLVDGRLNQAGNLGFLATLAKRW